MFHNATHLPQRLDSEDYFSESRHQRELDTMFLPGWQFIGDMTQLRRDGDYFTLQRFNRPLICWRTDGQVHTFLNVCSHRQCTLTNMPCGKFGKNMKCQYHSWEFDAEGNTCRIPDAKSFRPLTKQLVRLRKYRTETVGKLIFATFNEDAPSLAEYLGEPFYGLCQEWFLDDYEPTAKFDEEFPCNWKVIFENILESYHVESLHKRTFVQYAPEEDCTHTFREHGDEFLMNYESWGASRRMEWAISKWVGVDPTYRWRHVTRYPNFVIANSSLVSYIQVVVPISPTRCDNVFRVFHYPGARRGPRRWLADKMLGIGARSFVGRVLREDASLYPHVQIGVTAAERPNDGLISVREERIFAFQDYVLKATREGRDEADGGEAPTGGEMPAGGERASPKSAANVGWLGSSTASPQ